LRTIRRLAAVFSVFFRGEPPWLAAR